MWPKPIIRNYLDGYRSTHQGYVDYIDPVILAATLAEDLEIFKSLKDHGFVLFIDSAIEHKKYKIIEWFFNNGYHNSPHALITALKTKDAELLKWMLEKGFLCDLNVYTEAAKYEIQYLKILHSSDKCLGPNEEYTFIATSPMAYYTNAAIKGNIEVLDWLQENEFPWADGDLDSVVLEGTMDAFDWLKTSECPKRLSNLKAIANQLTTDEEKKKKVMQWVNELEKLNK
jgi:hypothetical protein